MHQWYKYKFACSVGSEVLFVVQNMVAQIVCNTGTPPSTSINRAAWARRLREKTFIDKY